VLHVTWSKSTPGRCAQPTTQSLALRMPDRLRLYTQVSGTRRLRLASEPVVEERLMSWKVPFLR